MQDLRYALRQLRKSPGFALIAVITLGLGIGANSAIFSVVNAVLLRPLPYPQADRLVIIQETSRQIPEISVSFPDYVDWRRDNTVFEHLAISRRESYNLSGLEGRAPEQISGAIVTANFFKVIGLAPQIGRVFTEEEDRVGGPMLCVISDKLWTRIFNRDPHVIGQSLNFGNEPYTVVGVMPPQMFSPRTVDVWFPFMRRSTEQSCQMRDNHPGLIGWGRIKRGVSLEKAQLEMSTIAKRIAIQYPQSNAQTGVKLTQFLENQVGEYRSALVLLVAAVAVVLLIACANLANLLAARGAARAREFAVRIAIGATRWQIIRQLLIESFVIALIGGLLGVCLAAWGRDLLVRLAPAGVRRFQETQIDGWVLGFTFLLSIITSVLFGLWPAWQTSRADAQSALKAAAHGNSDARAARRSRELLIVSEVALTLVLLSAGALVLKSFARVTSLKLGFEPHDLVTARVELPTSTYKADDFRAFSSELLQKLRALPGVESAAIATDPPLMTGWQTSYLPEGWTEPPPGQRPSTEMCAIQGNYFGTLKVPVLRGRTFNEHDTKDAPAVVMIDAVTAAKLFPGEDAVGKRLLMQTGPQPQFHTIIGVVPRLKIYGFDEGQLSLGQSYVAEAQQPSPNLILLLRTSSSPRALERPLRQAVSSVDPAQPVFELETMQDRVEETWATPRLMTFLLVTFAGLALTLAIVGLYGVMAYNALRRTREIGVRLALGARRRQISSMMLRQGARLLVIGLLAGFTGAFVLGRVIRSLLFEVTPSDPFAYIGVTFILVTAALAACYLPARRAARVDPMVILRAE